MLLLCLGYVLRVLLRLLFYSHVGQVDGLVLDPYSHQFVLILDKFTLAVHLFLSEVVTDELLNLLVERLDLDVLSFNHGVEVGVLHLELVCGFWVGQVTPHFGLQLLKLSLQRLLSHLGVLKLLVEKNHLVNHILFVFTQLLLFGSFFLALYLLLEHEFFIDDSV